MRGLSSFCVAAIVAVNASADEAASAENGYIYMPDSYMAPHQAYYG